MRPQILLLSLTAAVLVTGCSNREAQLEGKWKLSNFSMPSGQNAKVVQMLNAMKSTISIEFKKDKNFSMSMVVPIEGTWNLSGDALEMTTTKVMGMDIGKARQSAIDQAKNNPALQKQIESQDSNSQNFRGTLSSDGKTLTLKGNSAKGGELTFAKDSGA